MIDELLRGSLGRRERLLAELGDETDCYRLFHGVAEGCPGVAIDRYGPILLFQTWRDPIGPEDIASCARVTEDFLREELSPVWNHRNKARNEPFSRFHDPTLPERPMGRELGVRYDVRPRHHGLDPFLFLDSRAMRRRVKAVAPGLSVLNLFAYTGSAGLVAALGGAREVWNVDFSDSALRIGERNAAANGLPSTAMRAVREDVIPVVRQLAGLPVTPRRGRSRPFHRFEPRTFDLVVLDPPRWAKGSFGAVDVVRDYPSLLKPALFATAPGGSVLATNNAAEVDVGDWLRVLERTGEKCGRAIAGMEILEPEADFPSFDGAPPLKMAWVRLG